ncbi:MAG: bifunctional adenosylcobinamide kinase/adenosylcobinamide-phosphate guanylyltransferase [Megasphaera cerevisiae]|jgi:adenosylcobinamide kinase/adenosylcobinamide-phosphate guanylyltransferase|nr:bifunctional adenosylcobinamide kinase/adenosylcobinamide-phosphate guanylyltransferase [Megasphaera cerevisiae]
MMKSKIIIVTGGARSGKSAFAEHYLMTCKGRHAYVATAQILDEEMAERVAAHRCRRPAAWQTFECPAHLPDQLANVLETADAVLVDCLTLYFSNFLFRYEAEIDGVVMSAAEEEMRHIIEAVKQRADKTVVFVTNELGSGIVPMEKISRLYRDIIGRINQYAAAAADEVYLTVCGIPMEIKSRQIMLPMEERQ